MRDIYIRTESGELRKVSKKKLIRLVLILLGIIAAITAGIVLIVRLAAGPKDRAEEPAVETEAEPITGDIFDTGYYKKHETQVLSAGLSETALMRLEESKSDPGDEVTAVYREMKRDNPDFAGYLKIDGTNIEYPVMYTPDEPEKYLHKDINGKDSDGGLPFIDARCTLSPESDNIIIYGHNMRDGSKFGELDLYKDQEYCTEHPVIHFDSAEGSRKYEVMSVFYDRVYYTDEEEFRFYDFIDAADREDYDANLDRLIDKSLYDTGVAAEYGDHLLTLVTCSYHEDNGRFVVIAREVI